MERRASEVECSGQSVEASAEAGGGGGLGVDDRFGGNDDRGTLGELHVRFAVV